MLDAEAQSGRPRAAEIDLLCERVAGRRERRESQEWAELAPTVVAFEELT